MGLTSRIVCDGSAAGRQVQLSVSGQWRGHGRSACTPRRTRIASRAWHDQLANTNWPKRGCRNGPSLLLQGRAVCVCSQRAPSACSFNLFIFRFWQEQRSVLAGQLERSWSLSTTVTRGVLLYLHFFFGFGCLCCGHLSGRCCEYSLFPGLWTSHCCVLWLAMFFSPCCVVEWSRLIGHSESGLMLRLRHLRLPKWHVVLVKKRMWSSLLSCN
jgi:hypothetical protein